MAATERHEHLVVTISRCPGTAPIERFPRSFASWLKRERARTDEWRMVVPLGLGIAVCLVVGAVYASAPRLRAGYERRRRQRSSREQAEK